MPEDTVNMQHTTRRGFSLLETSLVTLGITMVFGSMLMFLRGTQNAWLAGNNQSSLQERARNVLHVVLNDLRRTGITTLGGQNFPAIWERPAGSEDTPRGDLVATLALTDSDKVDEVLATNGDGSSRLERNRSRECDEIVFQLPRDLDGNRLPVDANGATEFGPELISYRVIDVAGVPTLMRIVEREGVVVDRRSIGQWVRKITFDALLNDRTLRFNEVAVVIYLDRTNDRGQRIEAAVDGTIVMRNTEEQ